MTKFYVSPRRREEMLSACTHLYALLSMLGLKLVYVTNPSVFTNLYSNKIGLEIDWAMAEYREEYDE